MTRPPARSRPTPRLLLSLLLLLPAAGQAASGEEAFLACAAFSERAARLACLEGALEAALAEQEVAPVPAPAAPASPPAAAAPALAGAGARQAPVSAPDDAGAERRDDIATLREYRPNQWLLTLRDGSSWRQTHPKRFNLREGQAVRIYPSRWGDNYRLEAAPLSGFIQVTRVE